MVPYKHSNCSWRHQHLLAGKWWHWSSGPGFGNSTGLQLVSTQAGRGPEGKGCFTQRPHWHVRYGVILGVEQQEVSQSWGAVLNPPCIRLIYLNTSCPGLAWWNQQPTEKLVPLIQGYLRATLRGGVWQRGINNLPVRPSCGTSGSHRISTSADVPLAVA